MQKRYRVHILLWILLIGLSFSPASSVYAQWFPKPTTGEWHVLLIAATADKLTGSAHAHSLHQAEKQITDMAQWMGLELHIYRITGEGFTEDAVKKGVRDLINLPRTHSGKSMATVMTFTHGLNFEETWTRLPFMVCHPTTFRAGGEQPPLIALEDIYHSLRAFGNFDHIHVWAELCNNIPYGLKDKAPASQPMLDLRNHLQVGKKGEHLRKLLMGVPASLMVSSSYGQVSYAFKNAGGLFTSSLFFGLEKVANGSLDAHFEGDNGLFTFVQLHTQELVQALAGNMRQQTPQGYIGDIPRDVPMPASNIVRAMDKMHLPSHSPKKKTALDIVEELWKP